VFKGFAKYLQNDDMLYPLSIWQSYFSQVTTICLYQQFH